MNDGTEEIRKIYRDYLEEELKKPEVLEARKKLAAHFQAAPVLSFEPAAALAVCLLAFLFTFCYQAQRPLREIVRPETQPVMLALNPAPVQDSVKPGIPHVLVRKISSEVGPTLVYQKNHEDVPITVVWVFVRGGQ